MLFKKYKNYLKLLIAVQKYNQDNLEETISFNHTLKSIKNLSDDFEVDGVIDALNDIY